jgi:hypothetical protein
VSTTHFRRPPAAVRRAKLDNLALVPGSMLPYMEACQESANRLPKGAVLIVLPQQNEAQKRTMLLVAKLLAAEGHQVAVISAAQVHRHPGE